MTPRELRDLECLARNYPMSIWMLFNLMVLVLQRDPTLEDVVDAGVISNRAHAEDCLHRWNAARTQTRARDPRP